MSGARLVSNRIFQRWRPDIVGLAAGQHERDAEFVIQPQQVRRRIAHDAPTELDDLRLGLRHDVWMQAAQEAIDLEIAIVTVRREADHLIGAYQAAEAVRIDRR